MHTSYQHLLTTPAAAKAPIDVLAEPVTALLGVGPEAAAALAMIHVETVFDLAASATFHAAASAAAAADTTPPDLPADLNGNALVNGVWRHLDRLPLDLIDAPDRARRLAEIADLPLVALRAIDAPAASQLAAALHLTSVRDLGLWPPFKAACTVLSQAYAGRTPPSDPDPLSDRAPADLLPTTGRHPTERVQYQILLFGERIGPGVGPMIPPPTAPQIETAGPIDLTDGAAQGFTRPAIGAVLTYTQSWYAQGVALGHLLHSVALAPGETTRVAVLDWSRRTGARIGEEIRETEALTADLVRGRSLQEVVDAVAEESQTGFSAAMGAGAASQHGSGGGGAVDLTSLIGIPLNVAGGTSDAHGMGGSLAAGFATSHGRREVHAEMTQNITDSTHQAASSARNRWATVVREVSQEESDRISTRALANFNHMHALTVQYYEVVQFYRTVVQRSRVDRCLFVPMRTIRFRGTDAALRHRAVIAAYGLIPEVRALAHQETDSVRLEAPDRNGPWQVVEAFQALLAQAGLRYDATAAGLVLPDRFGLAWIQFSPPLGTLDVFAQISLRFADGREIPIPFDRAGMFGLFALIAKVPEPLPDLSEITAVVLHKKADKTAWTGEVSVALSLRPPAPAAPLEGISYRVTVRDTPTQTILTTSRTYGSEQLVRHLEDNALYYSQAIWRTLDAGALSVLLDTHTIATLDGRKTLGEVVDQTPLAVSGNYLILKMPVHADTDTEWKKFLARSGLTDDGIEESLVPLPTGGVFAEAVLGRANSAEKIDITRFWNWQDSPAPITAPEIAALQSASRAQAEPQDPKSLGSPVVTIQNTPALPDPTGMSGVLQALANGAMFRDMSGLAGTQQLARTFIEQAMLGATEAGRQAGQNMRTAVDYAQRGTTPTGGGTQTPGQGTGGQQGSGGKPTDPRWGGPTTPNSSTMEGGRLNHARDMDERSKQNSNTPNPTGPQGPPQGGGTLQAENAQFFAGISGGAQPAVVPASFFRTAEPVVGETSDPTGSQPTLSEARRTAEILPMWKLSGMDRERYFLEMSSDERRDWVLTALGPFSRQFTESAARHKVPARLVAATVLNELTDIDWRDRLQDFVQPYGSLGIAQIQLSVAVGEKLFPDITPDEIQRALDSATLQSWFTSPEDTRAHRLAVAVRLRIPQHAIDAAARYIRVLLNRASRRTNEPWQKRFGLLSSTTPLNSPEDWYAHVSGSSLERRTLNLAQLITGLYNSPSLLTAADPEDHPNGVNNAESGRLAAQVLVAADLFGP